MVTPPDWAPPGINTSKASTARMYDYMLGGQHNFAVDREAVARVEEVDPDIRRLARANREFLQRAVQFLAEEAGVRQFLDLGSGIPTAGNVHEVAPQANVVYVDNDEVAGAHSRMILRDVPRATIVSADLRDPRGILEHPETTRLLDLDQPVALLLCTILHFVVDQDAPQAIVANLREAMAPGSYLALSHATTDIQGDRAKGVEQLYTRDSTNAAQTRSREEITRFFGDGEFVEPGLSYLTRWRPEPDTTGSDDPERYWFYAGVARL